MTSYANQSVAGLVHYKNNEFLSRVAIVLM